MATCWFLSKRSTTHSAAYESQIKSGYSFAKATAKDSVNPARSTPGTKPLTAVSGKRLYTNMNMLSRTLTSPHFAFRISGAAHVEVR